MNAAPGGGDIWSTGAFSFESPLKDLLDSGNYTIEQLLAEDELLQELRGIHPVLTSYFATESAVTKLIHYVTVLSLDASAPKSSTAAEVATTESTAPPMPAADLAADSPGDAATPDEAKPKVPGEWLMQHHSAIPVTDSEDTVATSAAATATKSQPEHDADLLHIRFPYMACEIICCEIPGVIVTLMEGHVDRTTMSEGSNARWASSSSLQPETILSQHSEDVELVDRPIPPRPRLLDMLFAVLSDTPPGQLDDYRAGYLDKILGVLFRSRPLDMSAYLKERQDVLMPHLLQHLYSHSILQIAQRLLLPQRPVPQKEATEESGEAVSAPVKEKNEIVAVNGAANPDAVGDEPGEGILIEAGEGATSGEDDDAANPQIQCEWSESPLALEILLDMLTHGAEPTVDLGSDEAHEEYRLNVAQNVSETLITMIQNSLLSSALMLSLTASATMRRIIDAATTPPLSFSPQESSLTAAMNVLESLILQLGGYGAVGTMSLLPEEDGAGADKDIGVVDTDDALVDNDGPLIADLSALLEHMPLLLSNLAGLLRHPSTQNWTSPMQFARHAPQPLLGTSRLRIIRVLEALVLLGDYDVDNQLVASECLQISLDLFWEFQWCSMLHQSVANLLVHVFEGHNARCEMQEHILVKCNLLGRLMDSFNKTQDAGHPENVGVVVNLQAVSGDGSSAPSATEENADPLPISDEDVESAMDAENERAAAVVSPNLVSDVTKASTEALQLESKDPSISGVGTPAQAFRMGYMGHVIIICQALVQACVPDDQSKPDGSECSTNDNTTPSDDFDFEQEPLLLVKMIEESPLFEKWEDFVTSTLATETAIQSTPLGGYAGQNGVILQAHRPGLTDDGIAGDGSSPLPSRGIGGEMIDMDDNDLDVAATMMAGLDIKRPGGPDGSDSDDGEFSGSGASGDSERTYNSGETNRSGGGYLFDDPLGRAGGELGIELGKLTRYRPSTQEDNGEGLPDSKVHGGTGASDEDDDGSHSSSDEEPEPSKQESDVPVMDLFAGNFSCGSEVAAVSPAPAEMPSFADFANFAEAHPEDEDVFGDFASAPNGDSQDPSDSSSKSEIEELFGTGDHANLLEDDPLPDDERKALEAEQETTAAIAALAADFATSSYESVPEAREAASHEETVAQEEPQEQQEPVAGDVDLGDNIGSSSSGDLESLPSFEDVNMAPSDEIMADKVHPVLDSPMLNGVARQVAVGSENGSSSSAEDS